VRQQQATLSVLQVLQKLSSASPENFDVLKKELDKVLETDLPLCGAQQEILAAEAQRVVDYAQQYVAQVQEQRNAEIKQKKEEAEKQEKAEAIARDLLEQLEKLVVSAEEASEQVFASAAPLLSGNKLGDDEVIQIAAIVHKQGRGAMAACSFCADFITTKRPIIQEADSIQAASTQAIAALLPRIKGATRRTAEAFQKGKENRTVVCRRTAAKRAASKNQVLFDKYDSDNDGLLSMEDLAAYAKSEFKFDMPEDNLKRIESQLFPFGSKGLGVESFRQLKTAVGIAQTEVKGKENKVAREKKKEYVEGRQKEISATISEILKKLDADEVNVASAESNALTLASEAGSLQADELRDRAIAVEKVTKCTAQAIGGYRMQGIKIVEEVSAMPELEQVMRAECSKLDSRLQSFEERLQKASEMAASGRQLALYMSVSEY